MRTNISIRLLRFASLSSTLLVIFKEWQNTVVWENKTKDVLRAEIVTSIRKNEVLNIKITAAEKSRLYVAFFSSTFLNYFFACIFLYCGVFLRLALQQCCYFARNEN